MTAGGYSIGGTATRDANLSDRDGFCSNRPQHKFARPAILLAIFISLFGFGDFLRGEIPEDIQIGQMVHTSWTAREGAPQRITCLAQARDGSLWIGSDGGLYRFDGLSFAAFHSPPGEEAVPPGLIRSLLVANDGALWVATRTGGLIQIRDGHVRIFKIIDDLPAASFHRILQGPDSSLWALGGSKPVRLGRDGRWHRIGRSLNLPDGDVKDLFFDSQGTLWIAQTPDLYYLPAGATHVVRSELRIGTAPSFAQTTSGKLLLTDLYGHPHHGRLIELSSTTARRLPLDFPADQNHLFASSDGSLWVSPAAEGLERLRFQEHLAGRGAATSGSGVFSADRFGTQQGLSSETITSFLQDAQGNIWTGGIRGLDRFQRPKLMPLALRAPDGDLLAADTDSSGTLWIGVPGVGLYSMHGDSLRQEYGKRNYFGVFCGPDGRVWFDDETGLWQFRNGSAVFFKSFYPANATTLIQFAQQSSNVAFASLQNRNDPTLLGTFRIEGGQWNKIDFSGNRAGVSDSAMARALSTIKASAPTIMLIDSHQRLWNGYADGVVSLVDKTRTVLFTSGSSNLGIVGSLLETKQGILAAGTNGIAIQRENSFQMLHFEDTELVSGISGLVQSRNGDLWLNGRRGIARIPYAEFNYGLSDQQHQIVAESIAEGDFIGPAPFQPRHRTAFVGGDGTLWFVAPNGSLLHLDPQHISSPLPRLSIVDMVADGTTIPTNSPIPPKPNTLLIRYFGVDLAVPEKVMYRYKLDGVDTTWQKVGRRTEAVYTRLRPGKYTFHVQASNGSGEWTPVVSSVPFVVSPSFYQTTWFSALCLVVGVLTVLLLLQLRVQYVAARVRELADERANERIRIARDLHDTLLQGVQILLLTFQTVTDKIAADEGSKQMLNRAMSRAEMVIAEGRNQVKRLRSEPLSSENLIKLLQTSGQDLGTSEIRYQVQQHGTPRELKEAVAEEIYYIAREALANAFRHSGATSIGIDLHYGMRTFSLVCRDNGCGFDAHRFQLTPPDGHWGLRGMAERAGTIGADLICKSHLGRGTEITISLASGRAYLDGPGLARFRQLYDRLLSFSTARSSTLPKRRGQGR